MNATKSVQEICAAIAQHRMMSSKDYAAMRARWFRPGRTEVDDPERFRGWLALNRYLSPFVAKVLSGRKADQLVLNQYRLVDQLMGGPMAGAYLAVDPLDRHVAIEVLSADSAADKTVLAAFQEAAQKTMVVRHANVGRILDVGEAHGHHYLVKEYYEGQTLEAVLQRRKTLPYQQAARLMALVLAGVDALHSHGVAAGDLTANCLLLTSGAKDSPHHRTVKILHAGVKRKLFDETAIGRSISDGIPDRLELADNSTFQVAAAGAPNPAEDIFRLGCVFYRCVTGREAFGAGELPTPSRPAQPVCQAAPEVPEMLGQIIDDMIDPVAAKRPRKAAHVAKSLRVFLAADEHGREPTADAPIALPKEHAASEETEPEETLRLPPRKRVIGETGKLHALWEEVRPAARDLMFLAGGALAVLLLIFFFELVTGLRFIYLAGLATGAAASYFVEMLLRWRRTDATSSE